MSLEAVRLAMMDRYQGISGVVVPQDPLPMQIEDKSIIVFPRIGESNLLSKGRTSGALAIQSSDVMQVEYHRRVPYERLGSVIADVTEMVDAITDMTWGELAGGKFDDTILAITRVALAHFGEIGWNEWTFGARLEISFTHLTHISS